ncbi:hypothetical protein HGRIS_001646 [Hohenbuehelia grisea]|uniref:Uncharacterized protein n=1 Tax=Hohenbuehelia grisea TaxID=104357 RepID=A0ABR3JI38_9AGAR
MEPPDFNTMITLSVARFKPPVRSVTVLQDPSTPSTATGLLDNATKDFIGRRTWKTTSGSLKAVWGPETEKVLLAGVLQRISY